MRESPSPWIPQFLITLSKEGINEGRESDNSKLLGMGNVKKQRQKFEGEFLLM